MKNHIGYITLLVNNYDEAIEFYTKKMGFVLLEDNAFEGGRWVVVAPSKESQAVFTLMQPMNDEQKNFVGNQTGGLPLGVVIVDDCRKVVAEMKANGVNVIKEPKDEFWGVDALITDLYGNILDICTPPTEQPQQ